MPLILIIILIVLAVENYKIKNENLALKKLLKFHNIEWRPGLGILKDNLNNISHNNNVRTSSFPEKLTNNEVIINKGQSTQVLNERMRQSTVNFTNSEIVRPNIKNENTKMTTSSTLYIIGMLLIMIGAFIFLISSYKTLPGVVSFLILVSLQVFFYLVSKTCKEKFDLDKASNSFYYLAVAFIPIVILSLSFFNIVGDYFSITGDGVLLFFGASFLVTDIIYKYLKAKKRILGKCSVVAEILSILFISLFFTQYFPIIIFVLSIYNIIVYILLQGGFLEKKDYYLISNILYVLNIIILIFYINEMNITISISLMLYFFLSIYRTFKEENDDYKELYLVAGIICYMVAINIVNFVDKITYSYLSLILLIPLFGLTKLVKIEKSKDILSIMISVVSSMHVGLIINEIELNPISIIVCSILMINYVLSYYISKNHFFKYLSYLGLGLVLTSACHTIDLLNWLMKYVPLIVTIVIYSTEYFFNNLKDKVSNVIIGIILNIQALLLINDFTVLLPLTLLIALIYLEKESELYLAIPIMCSMSIAFVEQGIVSEIIILCYIVILSMLSLSKKKINMYTALSILAIFISREVIDYEPMIFKILCLIWSLSHAITHNKKYSKVYKVLSIIIGLSIYNEVLNTLEIEFSSIYSIGYYIALIYITRYILKETTDIEFIEYFIFSIVAVATLVGVENHFDGLVEVFIFFIIALISYDKYKSYFNIAVIFIFIYILIEVSEYLLLIPWYVYVVLIGIGFLAYATNEERKKKRKLEKSTKENIDLPKKIKEIEDNNSDNNK